MLNREAQPYKGAESITGSTLSRAAPFATPSEGWWSDLWRNADQQGEHLLQQGDAATAAHVYHDPRRRAYADLKAGHFSAAAQGFSAFDDSDAHYDRGNALARAGHLQAALDAYNAALKHNPNNADAKYNRDLVAKILKQQQKPPQSSKTSSDNKNNTSSDQNHSTKKDQGSSSKNQTNHSTDPHQTSGNNSQQSKNQQHNTPDKTSPPAQTTHQPDHAHPTSSDSGTEAKQDALTPLNHPKQNPQTTEALHADNTAHRGLHKQTEDTLPNEQQLSQEQWLRRIPDDPGGLLRRKFMIEYLMKHPEEAQQ